MKNSTSHESQNFSIWVDRADFVRLDQDVPCVKADDKGYFQFAKGISENGEIYYGLIPDKNMAEQLRARAIIVVAMKRIGMPRPILQRFMQSTNGDYLVMMKILMKERVYLGDLYK